MRVLVADDDPLSSALLKRCLVNWGHEVVVVVTGDEAYQLLLDDADIRLGIFDWQMPGMDGFELCYKIRNELNLIPFYVILLTGRGGRANTLEGLACGADEFVVKPFDPELLRARLASGQRSIEVQSYLVKRIRTLERFQRQLPVCPRCRRLNTDDGQWLSVAAFANDGFDPPPDSPLCPGCAAE